MTLRPDVKAMMRTEKISFFIYNFWRKRADVTKRTLSHFFLVVHQPPCPFHGLSLLIWLLSCLPVSPSVCSSDCPCVNLSPFRLHLSPSICCLWSPLVASACPSASLSVHLIPVGLCKADAFCRISFLFLFSLRDCNSSFFPLFFFLSVVMETLGKEMGG